VRRGRRYRRPVTVEALAQLVREAQPCVALTGAGISTESGIPDFRSPTGLWARFDPLEYGSIEAFRADPEKVWSFYAPRFRMLADAVPNAAHRALADLERRGLLRAVVTQNIDLLHERAGSRDVVEVHGSIRSSTCPSCGCRYDLPKVLEALDAQPVPRCERCGDVLKPDVVFFGELLDESAIARAYDLAAAADLLLVIGSALEVYPVAALPLETLRAGGRVAIVNKGPTAFDSQATLKLNGGAGESLGALVRELTAGEAV
jgi:NAD-dependent deacetylase